MFFCLIVVQHHSKQPVLLVDRSATSKHQKNLKQDERYLLQRCSLQVKEFQPLEVRSPYPFCEECSQRHPELDQHGNPYPHIRDILNDLHLYDRRQEQFADVDEPVVATPSVSPLNLSSGVSLGRAARRRSSGGSNASVTTHIDVETPGVKPSDNPCSENCWKGSFAGELD